MSDINITCEDNMKLMARYEDNHFPVSFVDPAYGIGASKPSKKPNACKQRNGIVMKVRSVDYGNKSWDDKPADSDFGNELFRVSQNQIICGGNFFKWIVGEVFEPPRRKDFTQFIKDHPKGWIIWDKVNGDSDQYDCELIWTSLDFNSFVIEFMWAGMRQGSMANGAIMEGNKKKNEKRMHPTQKPVRLYELVFNALINLGFIDIFRLILETNYGSGSIGLACYNLGLDLTACELDKEYFDASMQRLKIRKQHQTLF